jgi:hypothetical protein
MTKPRLHLDADTSKISLYRALIERGCERRRAAAGRNRSGALVERLDDRETSEFCENSEVWLM